MSRIGKKPVPVPDKVKVEIKGGAIIVEGPLAKLPPVTLHPLVSAKVEDGKVVVERKSDAKQARALQGLTRSLIANMIEGVTKGFQKALEIVGVGYNARIQGKNLVLNIGFNAPVEMPIPEGLAVESVNPTKFIVKGADKQKVGEFAAEVRHVRPPEPYKGKGIRYEDEQVRRKAGKAAVGAGP
jgi:large subunit ribosomal protein L6